MDTDDALFRVQKKRRVVDQPPARADEFGTARPSTGAGPGVKRVQRGRKVAFGPPQFKQIPSREQESYIRRQMLDVGKGVGRREARAEAERTHAQMRQENTDLMGLVHGVQKESDLWRARVGAGIPQLQARDKKIAELSRQQVGAQQRAVQREAELGTKDWQIKGLRDATAHITRQAEAAERGKMQTQSELDHADVTIRELNTMVQTLNQNARDANAETAARINKLAQQARNHILKLELKLQSARTAPILTARESAKFEPHVKKEQFVQPALTERQTAQAERQGMPPLEFVQPALTARRTAQSVAPPSRRLQESRAAVSFPVQAPAAGRRAAAPRPRARDVRERRTGTRARSIYSNVGKRKRRPLKTVYFRSWSPAAAARAAAARAARPGVPQPAWARRPI